MSTRQTATRRGGDERAVLIETLIGHVLRGGLVLSMGLILAGLSWRWFASDQFFFDYTIRGMNFFEFLLTDLRQLVSGAMRPRVLCSLGMAVLLFTPYLRVVASLVYFAVFERDLKYTFFTTFVLAVLTYSLLLR